MLDAIELLTGQHAEAREMLARLAADAQADVAARGELFAQLKDSLTLHTREEEEVFYPELEQFDETRALVEGSYEEHRQVEQLLERMAGGETADADSRRLLGELSAAVARHVAEEEGELFPRAARLLTPDRLRDMGYEMRRLETRQSENDQLIYPASRVGPA